MAEYIEQDVFIAELNREIDDEEALYDAIERSDEDDVVKVVRCKDCIYHDNRTVWCDMLDTVMYRNDFCNYGERREENEIE